MLQVKMDDCLSRTNSSDLSKLLRREGLNSVTLVRLDQLVTKALGGSAFSRVVVVLKSLEILSENRDDLRTLIDLGLTAKVASWLETVRDLLTSVLRQNSDLLTLTEDFYDFLLLLGRASLPVHQLSVVLVQLTRFALDPQIHFPLRLEAIKTFNNIVESLSREERRLIQLDQNQTQILCQVAAAVLTVGDYELQVSLSEALCRLTPRKERHTRANQWFSCRDISDAFCDIRDREFEVDCRRFLNFVNGYLGNQRRVFTFSCSRAFLDSIQLFRPKDEKLLEFWIDFNVGSRCVSFFIDEPQAFLWGSIHLLQEDLQRYSLELRAEDAVLSVRLNNPIMHQDTWGHTVELSFNGDLLPDLEEAARRVFQSGSVQNSSSAEKNMKSFNRKKPKSKSVLKILPLSSPSSDDESSVTKTPLSRAEFLFDQIRHSTPEHATGTHATGTHATGTHATGAPVAAKDQVEFGEDVSAEVFSGDRKRAADSGYLSDQTEGVLAHKRRAEPQPEGEESHSPGSSPEGAGPSGDGAGSPVERAGPVKASGVEPESDLTSGITAAFNTFKSQLEQQFTSCWTSVETEILLSLKECQRHVSSLLTAVHQHRLVLLQSFENSVTDQLNRLQKNSTTLNTMNTQILSFFQSEIQRLSSFCDENLQRLKSLEGEFGGGASIEPTTGSSNQDV